MLDQVHTALTEALSALPRASFTALKVVVFALFLTNARSWPLLWHWTVLIRPVLDLRIPFWCHLLSNVFRPKKQRDQRKAEWLARLCPVGADPIAFEVTVSAWAGPDDCDFNWHLSNSCYPRALDSARFRAALRICPTFFRVGGWLPLGATHFKFIKEIPMFARYEMRMSLAAWDEKWAYVVVRYVTLPKKSKGKGRKAVAGTESPVLSTNGEKESANGVKPRATRSLSLPSGDNAPFPTLHTPGSGFVSEMATPLGSRTSSFVGSSGFSPLSPLNGNGKAHASEKKGHNGTNGSVDLLSLPLREEADGATVHCVSVSELCFKIGRITVPPAVVFAMEGFHRLPDAPPSSSPDAPARYSHAHPPPSFVKSQALQTADLAKGHLRTLQRFLREGWRDVPAGERWWEDALGGEVEEKRRINLERVKSVREGMFGAAATLR